MTLPTLYSSGIEFAIATFRTQSANEFAAHYEAFHGGHSAEMSERGRSGAVASLSTQTIDQLRLAYRTRSFGSKGTLTSDTEHYDVRVPLVDGSGNTNSQNAQPTAFDRVVILSASEGLEPCSKAGNVGLNLAISNSFLTSCAMSLYQNECGQPLEFDGRIRLGSPQSMMLKSLFDHLVTFLVLSPNSLENPNVVACIGEHAARVLLSVLPYKYAESEQTARPKTTPRIVRKAEEYMRQFAGEPLTLTRICAHAGCSLRALQTAFRQFRDTTPIKALHEIRLEGAHHDLKNDVAPVTQIAHKWGFSHPGRFSVSYRAKYGEYPSETVQARSHSSGNAPGGD